MAKLAIKKASTDVTTYVFIQDSSKTTGEGLTGLAYNTSSLVGYYVRPKGSATAITLATQTVTGDHSDGGFKEVDATNMPGVYRLDLPDAVCATGVPSVVVMLKGAANMSPVVLEIQLTDLDPNTAAITAAAVADAVWDEATADHTTASSFGALDANVDAILADTGTDGVKIASAQTVATVTNLTNLPTMPTDWVTAAGLKADAVTKIQSGLATSAALTTVDANVDSILADTGTDGVVLASTQGAITWAQQKIVANVAMQGALDISNTNANSYGVKNYGGWSGVKNEGFTQYGVINTGGTKNVFGHDPALALESTLTAIKGAGWSTETLAAIDVLIDAIKAKTDLIPATPAVADEYDAALAAIQADLDNPNQYKADVSGLATSAEVGAITMLDEVVVGSYTMQDILKILAAKMVGKATGGGTTTITYRGVDDTSDVIIETVDSNGNRSAVTLTV